MYKTPRVYPALSASKMTYIVSGGALNSAHSLTTDVLLHTGIGGVDDCIVS